MTDRPLISVVIPTYNRCEPTIAAIRSVLDQTYRPLELIVVDDGSSDGSGETIGEYIQKQVDSGERIMFIKQDNRGAGAARNAGIFAASGDYIAFLDSDDLWLPEKLEKQIASLARFRNARACFTDSYYSRSPEENISTFHLFGRRYESSSDIDRNATRSISEAFCGFFLSTLLVSTEVARQIGGFNAAVSYCEDRDFYFRLSLITPLVYVNELLVRCDRTPTPAGSSCRPWDRVEVRLTGIQRMYESWLELGSSVPAPIRRIILDGLRRTHCDWANWHLGDKRYNKARQAVSRAIRYSFTPKMSVKWLLIWAAPSLAARLSGHPASYL